MTRQIVRCITRQQCVGWVDIVSCRRCRCRRCRRCRCRRCRSYRTGQVVRPCRPCRKTGRPRRLKVQLPATGAGVHQRRAGPRQAGQRLVDLGQRSGRRRVRSRRRCVDDETVCAQPQRRCQRVDVAQRQRQTHVALFKVQQVQIGRQRWPGLQQLGPQFATFADVAGYRPGIDS